MAKRYHYKLNSDEQFYNFCLPFGSKWYFMSY